MKKNRISKNWIINQHRDPYFKEAKHSGLRSRSAFKLLELNEKFKFFNNCKAIIDLGSYPGGWSQIIKKNIKNCKILSVDIKKMDKIDGVDFLCCDFQKQDSKEKILKTLGSKADVIVSDMAVNTTGVKNLDSIQTGELCKEAMIFSKDVISSDGFFISKLFMGSSFNEIVALGKKIFKEVKVFKPQSSRKESKESFIVCKNLR